MKKNVIKSSLLAGMMFLTFGCSEDFLVTEPSEFFTDIQLEQAAETNPAIIAGTVAGIYTTLFRTQTGGTTGHDDFGHKGYDLFADFLSSDVALSVSTYGWYRASITEYQCTQDFTFADNRQVWQFYYTVVRSCNNVIDLLGGSDVTPELDENKWLLGQALTLRGFAYFYLTQYFQNDYDPNAEILPLYTTAANQGVGKSTAGEIYAFIEADLNQAIGLMQDYNRPSKNQVNKYVAEALLAYTIASTRDVSRMQEVVDLTDDIINNSGSTVMSAAEITGGFNNIATPGWLWGADLNADIGLGLVSWWGQMDAYTYSYAWAGDAKAIDRNLYDAIPADDARKAQFFPGAGYYNLMPLDKFYDPNRVIGGQAVISTDYLYMRVAEMHLLKAEALAKMGQDGPARTALAQLLAQRLPDTSYLNGLSGQALQDEIYLQTRIELWGEGKGYLAMKRNQQTNVRGTNHLSFVGQGIPYNDERMTFEIPEREIQDNPFINTQN
jgi:hypothetical protein